ncbi:MAG: surface-adhesin E family protein [Syntrophales bacterium]
MDKRRLFSRLCFGVLTFLLILPCSMDANGTDWIRYGKGDRGKEFFYDAQDINYLPHNSVQVPVKMVPGDGESRLREITEWRKGYPAFPDNFSYSTFLYEINCSDRTFKVLQGATYNTNNEIIIATTIEHPLLEYISPASMMEGLHNRVCVKQDLRK